MSELDHHFWKIAFFILLLERFKQERHGKIVEVEVILLLDLTLNGSCPDFEFLGYFKANN